MLDWLEECLEAARASARSLPIGSEEGMGSDRMLGLCSYGCFAAEGERTASAPEGAVVNQAASAKSGPQPRLPSSSASSSSSGEEKVSAYAPAEREAFGRLSTMRASGGKIWQTVEQLLGFAPGTLDHSVERAAPQEASAASGSVASGAQAAAVDPPSPTSMAASLAA